jgi:1-acyl-sn-glycerol-3-phosphate acyltransferase
MRHDHLHQRARERGVNPLVYWIVRAVFQPFFHLYFRLSRIGREHVPAEGPVIFTANHRSFLDPFVIGTLARRPMYYVAKRELFEKHPLISWWLNALGAFPVDRGAGDTDMIETAKAILARGDCVLIFAEGTRVRPGPLGRPRRGVGRLALESGAPVVPVAVTGTERIRRGWRIRPHKVRIRVGAPLRFPRVENASPQLAAAVTDRIWPCVMLQWEWLGGLPPVRQARMLGAPTPLAPALAAAGIEVGPDVPRPDLVVLSGTAADLPRLLARHGAEISPSAGVLVDCPGVSAAAARATVADHTRAWATGVLVDGEVDTDDPAFAKQVRAALAVSADRAAAPARAA